MKSKSKIVKSIFIRWTFFGTEELLLFMNGKGKQIAFNFRSEKTLLEGHTNYKKTFLTFIKDYLGNYLLVKS